MEDIAQYTAHTHPGVTPYVNRVGFLTPANPKPEIIPVNDVTLITEFIRAFLAPGESINPSLSNTDLHQHIQQWYAFNMLQPVKLYAGSVIVAMCKAGFIAYNITGHPDCFYNIRERDIADINKALSNPPVKPQYKA